HPPTRPRWGRPPPMGRSRGSETVSRGSSSTIPTMPHTADLLVSRQSREGGGVGWATHGSGRRPRPGQLAGRAAGEVHDHLVGSGAGEREGGFLAELADHQDL